MKTKILWNKMPSVTREGRFFYTHGNVTVMQSWLSGNWEISQNGQTRDGQFVSSKTARKAAEVLIAI